MKGRPLTEKDMEGSEHKLSYMSEFDKLVEVCRVAAELYDQENESDNVDKAFDFDKSWGKRPVRADQEISNKTTLLSSTTCRIKKRTYYGCEDFEYYGKNEKVLEMKRTYCRSIDEEFEYSVKKEKKSRSNVRVRNRVVETAALPVEFADEIQRLGGNDVRLLIQKSMTATDLNPSENRFLIPVNQVREEGRDFLTGAEKKTLDQRTAGNGIVAMPVAVLEPNLSRSCINFKKWPMNTSFSYVLCGSWTVVQKNNHLQVETDLQVWSFRVNGELNLALVKVPQV